MKAFSAKRWSLANTLAFTIAYCIYSLIAHGFTGGHGAELSSAQTVAHVVGLTFVGLIVGVFQYYQLKGVYELKIYSIVGIPILFNALFWFGYYLMGPPLDILLSFPVLGSSLWVLNEEMSSLNKKYRALSFSSFLVGTLVGLTLLVAMMGVFEQLDAGQGNILIHAITWLIIAIPTGALGGYLSGVSISKSLEPQQSKRLPVVVMPHS